MSPTAFDAYLNEHNTGTKALSRASGVSATAIRKWRQGGTYPQIDKARAVAITLGIPLDDLAEMIMSPTGREGGGCDKKGIL